MDGEWPSAARADRWLKTSQASSQRPGELATGELAANDLASSRPASQHPATCEPATSLHPNFINLISATYLINKDKPNID
ncbi:UNVERIFIED_CONTAM: hypothetical protein Sradi_3245000 [Sesamum radiatum]|uniref:Uncharacterized protein n=1 Tax=Sesamum radiatum TaxID=300843 RepID=A0AAW2R0P7_SESRA